MAHVRPLLQTVDWVAFFGNNGGVCGHSAVRNELYGGFFRA